MFILFYNLYVAMFTGEWAPVSNSTTLANEIKSPLNALGKLITSIFGDSNFTTFGDEFLANSSYNLYKVTALVLALITSIGIVVMAVKGIKRVFSVFFMGVR